MNLARDYTPLELFQFAKQAGKFVYRFFHPVKEYPVLTEEVFLDTQTYERPVKPRRGLIKMYGPSVVTGDKVKQKFYPSKKGELITQKLNPLHEPQEVLIEHVTIEEFAKVMNLYDPIDVDLSEAFGADRMQLLDWKDYDPTSRRA